jgi:hypothetical protein
VLDKMRVQLAETLIEVSNVEFRHLVIVLCQQRVRAKVNPVLALPAQNLQPHSFSSTTVGPSLLTTVGPFFS